MPPANPKSSRVVPNSSQRRFPFLTAVISLLFLSCVQIVLLKSLPNSSSLIENFEWTSLPKEDPIPNKQFELGSLKWDIEHYARAEHLEPIRAYFRPYCNGRGGLEAACEVSDQLTEMFPYGSPSREFLYAHFDPVNDFTSHREGEPGHCVTFSGLLSAALLTNSVPARVVQFVPYKGDVGGHTVIEVWDQEEWVVFDPTYGGILLYNGTPCSALDCLRHPREIQWRQIGKPHAFEDPTIFYEGTQFPLQAQHGGHLMYPEPWLYLRVGHREAFWPFRGKFIRIGEPTWKYGPAHTLLRMGTLVSLLAALVCCLLWVTQSIRRLRHKSVTA